MRRHGSARLADHIQAGAANEVPLTNYGDSVMDERVTVDLVWSF
jgi:hypothetical protein